MKIKDYIKQNGMQSFKAILTDKGKDRIKSPNWIITDTRFPNEAHAVKDRGGIIVRINRPESAIQTTEVRLKHSSETSLDNYSFDYIIENDSDIPTLIGRVEAMLRHFKII